MWLRIIIVSLVIFVTGCAMPPSATSGKTQSWPQRQAQLNKIHNWDLQSAVSIRQAQHANIFYLRWQQQGDHYQQQVSGPLNISAAQINGRPGKVILQQGNKPPVVASSPEKLMQEELDMQLPISNLYYWVRGVPVPSHAKQMQLDNAGRLAVLKQQGWTIQYLNYTAVNGIDLPSTILLNSPGLAIKMVIKAWGV